MMYVKYGLKLTYPSNSYTQAKAQLLSNQVLKLSDGVPVHIAASLIAGTVATTVCAPADVLKSRLQSATSVNGASPVSRKPPHKSEPLLMVLGNYQNCHGVDQEGRARIFDERLDTSMAETGVSNPILRIDGRTNSIRPNTVLMFLFMEQLQRLVSLRTL